VTNLLDKLSTALQACGHTSLTTLSDYALIGEGAWHHAYLVKRGDHPSLVVRLRKRMIYGEIEPFDPAVVHNDYAPVGLYYHLANACQPAICPPQYSYHIDQTLSCTVESYMGTQLDYGRLTEAEAYNFGCDVGSFFHKMQQRPAPIPGYGAILWHEGELVAESQFLPATVWQAHPTHNHLQQLSAVLQPTEARKVEQILIHILQQSAYPDEPFTLVNRDITPENLMAANNVFSGLIDPVPRLDNPTRFAAWFVFCYKFLLPVYNPVPRYSQHQFQQYAAILGLIAQGYWEAYTQNDPALEQQMTYAYYLLVLEEAYDCYALLQRPLPSRLQFRYGNKLVIQQRLQKCLHELGKLQIEF
jgi:hypothetical protein